MLLLSSVFFYALSLLFVMILDKVCVVFLFVFVI